MTSLGMLFSRGRDSNFSAENYLNYTRIKNSCIIRRCLSGTNKISRLNPDSVPRKSGWLLGESI